jgi:hypothetical protein
VKSLESQPRRCLPACVRRILVVSALLAALAALAPAAASAALTATQIRIGNHPAFVRVVVDFTGGTLHRSDVESPEPNPFDGRARVRVTHAGIDTTAGPVTDQHVTARIRQGSGFLVLKLSARKHRFKYLEHGVLHSPERLVVDLWKARPPSRAAEFPTAPQGGCLSIDTVSQAPGRISATGTENDVFEHMFLLSVRDQKGRPRGARGVTATGGHWHRTVQYGVASSQPGTLEAVDFSEQDGSLSCIAQVRVALQPAP